ncbi:MAG: hypothetical protein PF572_00775, partial [Patescibacteria group bacterium]|nr:hypothetical protein [Patescibacteria group bacterium]
SLPLVTANCRITATYAKFSAQNIATLRLGLTTSHQAHHIRRNYCVNNFFINFFMPRKIIVIGTLHAGITPNNELKEVIESFKPDQLLVEINNDDIVKNDLSSYPPEMIFAFEWAKSNNVKVAGFDSTIDVFREGVTPENNQAIIEKQKKLIKKLSWKDFNKIKNEKLLDVDGMDELTDKDKESAREVEMLKNIKANIIESGTVVLITGTAHLNFFERTIKDAIFPFRNSHSNNV